MALTNYVIMPGEDYQAICDKVRAKTGKTDVIKSGDLATEIDGISGGGGGTSGDERVKYVTFMYGEVELLKYPVISGDTCHDPVADGMIDTPTKEQTVSTVYTYSGWALTDGSAASSAALQNVTEDRTVYVAFTESVRKYTINFYDGETLLKSEQMAYGTTPNYIPEKDGVSFTGWSPSIVAVVGNADYYAQWQDKVTFAGGSWADIVAIAESGEAPNVFKVGDTREIVMEGQKVTLAIAGFNHDDLADGSGKAGMTIVTQTLYGRTCLWRVGTNGNESGPYKNSSVHAHLNTFTSSSFIGYYIPKEIVDTAKLVTKQVEAGIMSSNTGVSTIDAKFFALSATELGYESWVATATSQRTSLGERYELFPLDGDLRCTVADGTEYGDYWLRQIVRNGFPNICYQNPEASTSAAKKSISAGTWYKSDGTYYQRRVRFGFCI
jgi:hypothetical protein